MTDEQKKRLREFKWKYALKVFAENYNFNTPFNLKDLMIADRAVKALSQFISVGIKIRSQ